MEKRLRCRPGADAKAGIHPSGAALGFRPPQPDCDLIVTVRRSPRQNRVDPWGDMHALPTRGMFMGIRGCLVDDDRRLKRHHNGSLWIICQTSYRDWKHPLDAPHTWTPLFFLDEAVALAAGHRPCGLCRRPEYLAYRQGVTTFLGRQKPVLAPELNRRLAAERLRRGRGLHRATDRILTTQQLIDLPNGSVVLHPRNQAPSLIMHGTLRRYAVDHWASNAEALPGDTPLQTLTPPTSLAALKHGFSATLHESACR